MLDYIVSNKILFNVYIRLDPALMWFFFCCFNNIRGKFDSLVSKAEPFTLLTIALLLCNIGTGKLGVTV